MAFRSKGEIAPATLADTPRLAGRLSIILKVAAAVYDVGITFLLVRTLILGSPAQGGTIFGLSVGSAAIVLTLMLLVLMASTGVFRRWPAQRASELLIRYAASQAVAVAIFVAGVLAFAILPGPGELIGFAIASVVLMTAGRLAYMELIATPAMRRPVLLVGSPSDISSAKSRLTQDVYADTVCVGVVACGPATSETAACAAHPTANDIMRIADLHGAKEIVVVSAPNSSPIYEALLQSRFAGFRVRSILQESERLLGAIDPMWFAPSLLAFDPEFGLANLWYRSVKRLIDIVAALILLVLLVPACATITLAIRLDDGGPVLYRQRRVGLGGGTFMLLKFRSMHIDAERDGVARWADSNDSRITRIGRFLRRSRLDELPQLLNVLRGEMSLIGPRPERPELTSELAASIPGYEFRHVVRPGITGWAQVNFSYSASIEDARHKLAYDLYYVKNCALLLDVLVLVQTIRVVLWPDGVR